MPDERHPRQLLPVARADDTLASDTDGTNLRISYRRCLSCQELVALRFMEKTGALREPGDPATSAAQLGPDDWKRWEDTWRRRYYTRFDIGAQISHREATSAAGSRPSVDREVATGLPLFHHG